MTNRSVCFDFDGTLIDSRHDIAAAANKLREQFDLEPLSVDRVAESVASGTRELVEGVLPSDVREGSTDEYIDSFREIYFEVCDENVQPYPEIPSLISDLSDQNLSIVTNKPLSMTTKILRTLNWDPHFDTVYGPDSFGRRKPDPRPLVGVLERWEVAPHELIMVGDTWTDVRAGNALGCRTIACLYGLGETEKTLAESPDETVGTVSELRDLIVGSSNFR